MKHIFLYTLFTIIYSTLVYLESVIYLKTRVQTKSRVAGHTHEPRIFALLWPECGGAADMTRLAWPAGLPPSTPRAAGLPTQPTMAVRMSTK